MKRLLLLSAVILLAAALWPQAAHAYSFQNPVVLDPLTKEVCPSTPGFTERIIVCVKESIVTAIYNYLVPFSSYIADFVGAACVLAVALLGTLMATGKRSAPVRDSFMTAVKIGAVVMFSFNFGGLYPYCLDIMEYMLDAVIQFIAYSPAFGCKVADPGQNIAVWQAADCTIDSLIGGIFDPKQLYFGIVGFLFAAIFSQTVGLFIALMGFMVIAQFLWAIIRSMYIFLSAYIAFAIMVLISPLFIPLILFRTTKGYFEKWLRITMGFMLQPLFLFTYLALMMAAYEVVVYTGPHSLYRMIAGKEVDKFDINKPYMLGQWLNTNGIYAESSQSSVAYNVEPSKILDKTVGFAIDKFNPGVFGTTKKQVGENVKLTEELTDDSEWYKPNNLPQDIILKRLAPASFFRVDIPVKAINWEMLASKTINPKTGSNYNPNDPKELLEYWVNLFLSCIMCVLTAYIFLLLLDLLPFIGSGVAGNVLDMPSFGTGQLAPPGDKIMSNVKDRVLGNLTGNRR